VIFPKILRSYLKCLWGLFYSKRPKQHFTKIRLSSGTHGRTDRHYECISLFFFETRPKPQSTGPIRIQPWLPELCGILQVPVFFFCVVCIYDHVYHEASVWDRAALLIFEFEYLMAINTAH